MINKDKIPDSLYVELIDLLGYENAEKYLDSVQYNYYSINIKIVSEKLKRRFGKRNLIYFWVLFVVVVIVYQILSINLII